MKNKLIKFILLLSTIFLFNCYNNKEEKYRYKYKLSDIVCIKLNNEKAIILRMLFSANPSYDYVYYIRYQTVKKDFKTMWVMEWELQSCK